MVEGPKAKESGEFEQRPWDELLAVCNGCDFEQTYGFFYEPAQSSEIDRFYEMRDYLFALHHEQHPSCTGQLTLYGPPEDITEWYLF